VVTYDADPVNLACLVQGSQTNVIVLPEGRLAQWLWGYHITCIKLFKPFRLLGIYNSILGELHKHGTVKSRESRLDSCLGFVGTGLVVEVGQELRLAQVVFIVTGVPKVAGRSEHCLDQREVG